MAYQTAGEGHQQANATSHMCCVWVVELKSRETSPFPPRVWCEIGGRGSRLRRRYGSGGGQGRIGLRDFLKQVQVRPTRGESDHDAAGGDDHFGGDFDDASAPGADVTFAQRIFSAAGVEVATAAMLPRRGRVVVVNRRRLPARQREDWRSTDVAAPAGCTPARASTSGSNSPGSDDRSNGRRAVRF